MKPIALPLVLSIAAASLLSGPAVAQEARKKLMESKFWSAFRMQTAEGPVCWAVTTPVQSDYGGYPAPTGDAYLMATIRPRVGVTGELSVVSGAPFDDARPAVALVGAAKFAFFSLDDGAWIESVAEEKKMLAAMRQGSKVMMTAAARGGAPVKHEFSLSGFSAAFTAAQQACK